MADILQLRGVWNETTGAAYQEGTDYTDNNGVPAVIPGSALAAAQLAGDTLKYVQAVGSDTLPGTDMYYTVDKTYCALRKLAGLGSDWSSGTEIQIDLEGLHLNEHLRSHQSNVSFTGPADLANVQALVKDDWFALRLGLKTVDGSKTWRKEWRFKTTERKHEQDKRGIRHFRFYAADPSEQMRHADVSGVPRGADAETITYPGSDSTPQQSLIGPQLYRLSDLLAAVLPSGATLVLNAPDITIEHLPEQGDGLELLAYALASTSYDMRWDVNRLIIEQYEPRKQLVSLVITDDHHLEAKKQLGSRRKALDSVRIERPRTYPRGDLGVSTPDPELPPANESGSSPFPSEPIVSSLAGTSQTVYEVNKVWRPRQQFVQREPAPLLFAFSDPDYLKVNWSSEQLFNALRQLNGQVTMQPPIARFETRQINGYLGLDYYFKVPVSYVKIVDQNETTVDVYVVARAGLIDQVTGATSRRWTPIANARVQLSDPDTGIILSPATTNAAGYAQFDTGGNRARWEASVYHQTDAYLANKSDDFTTGHPYDDDPDNDALGPDNSLEVTDEWQLPEEQAIQFSIVWRNIGAPTGSPSSNFESLYEAYRGRGGFTYGQAGPEVEVVDELSSLDVDPANITTPVQAALWSEKKIEESEEELDVYEVTRMFSGTECEVGRVVRLQLAVDETINDNVRILTREIDIRNGEMIETFSSKVDKFVNEIEDHFAMKRPVEDKLREILKTNKKFADMMMVLSGLSNDEGNLSNG